ncbi:MAG: TetR/AcrR family transcriptional regulator [Actinobacteria bacterium ATB1]|nr:TetR/AcrR family transcriptional regulator [Actinobacteria bacterium ATB1]
MDLVTEQKMERRQRMLEATRRLVAQRGYDDITVKDLAEACRVSVPTIYNTFGGKDELIGEAVRANFVGVLERAEASVSEKGWHRVIGIVEHCAAEMVRLPEYHRSLIGFFAGTMALAGRGLPESLALLLADEIESALLEMRSARQLADWIDTRVLAEQIAGVCVMAAVEWAMGFHEGDGLTSAMIFGTSMLVLGVARGRAKEGLMERVRAVQADARAKTTPPQEVAES